jgi:DNA uptake protein ComE-like DNA-binding protein
MASIPATASEHARQEKSQSVALVVGILLGLTAGVCFLGRASTGPERPAIRLESRINPNTASAGSLVRLPGIGLTRAEAIVACRERSVQRNGDTPAFCCPADLMQIRGIGPKTVAGLVPWLRFEGGADAGSEATDIDRSR